MKANTPEIIALAPKTVLTITDIGDPGESEDALEALYGTFYATKYKVYKPQGKAMAHGKLIARWPDAHLKSKDEWTGIWGLSVPPFVTQQDLVQKNLELPVAVETWEYDKVAQILHVGPYDKEGPTIKRLYDFIKDSGYEIDGNSHEEEYLTSPDAKKQETIIRYKIKKPALK